MPHDFNSQMKDDLNSDQICFFHLIEFDFPGGILRFWTGYNTLTWNGNDYKGSGEILKSTMPKETKLMESAGAVFELSSEDPTIIAAAIGAEQYQDRPCRMYTGTWDVNINTVRAEPYLEYEGRMNTMPIEYDGKEAKITLTSEDESVILQRSRERRRTPEDQKKNYPNDKIFDGVPALQGSQTPWGK